MAPASRPVWILGRRGVDMAGEKLDPFGHVKNSDHADTFDTLGWGLHDIEIPGLGPVKFHILMAVCAVGVGLTLWWLGGKIRGGQTPRGYLWNLAESLLFFVRDKIARPALGDHDADKFLPFLLTLFLFIFANNMIGLLPFSASPTASIMVTLTLAVVSFFVIHTAGLMEHGFGGYLRTFVPHIHMEGGAGMKLFGLVLMVGMAALEYATAFIRATVLAIRLFANMLAGHTVLFILLYFIHMIGVASTTSAAADWLFWPVTVGSVAMVFALTLLEIFVAGLQAFIFTYLTAVFVGLAKHPPH